MDNIFPGRKRGFQQKVRYRGFLRLASYTVTTPGLLIIPSINILGFGFITAILFGASLGLYFFVWDLALLAPVMVVLFVLTVGSIVFAGNNGRRFVFWLGWRSLVLRKAGTVADQTPISRKSTRVFFYSLLAAELAFLYWWPVFTQAPRPEIGQFSDVLLYEDALINYAQVQLGQHAWLYFFVLFPLTLGTLKSLDAVPGVGFFLRRTRGIILLVPFLGMFVLTILFPWLQATYNVVVP